ncbi:peroxidase A2 [Daucus carota subsp. sativus]|uniref:peroxidase A2 n=1 Tax=Daucus carota subsp. sativus TaxID=79200 RepID=UPI0007B1E4E4|nr:PREDICTED: peroxidase A2-like [Daucus carota subsp. sativus]
MNLRRFSFLAILILLLAFGHESNAQLSPDYYSATCPDAATIVRNVLARTLQSYPRMGASLVRLHFHDCFVQGCDGSILLDNSPLIRSEKGSISNARSSRGFNVVDNMKAAVERYCPGVVSCADILAIASEAAVSMAGGPSWDVQLGRRDRRVANITKANMRIPRGSESLQSIITKFAVFGLTLTDVVALSGAHTFGKGRCLIIRDRLYNFKGTGKPDPTLSLVRLKTLRKTCSVQGALANLDPVTNFKFDNQYYTNLQNGKGLFSSDQQLFSTNMASSVALVNRYSNNQTEFFVNFARSMIKMGNIMPLTGNRGEVRLNCRRVN